MMVLVVTNDVYKNVKALLKKNYNVAHVAYLTMLSESTIRKINSATSYAGRDGYFKGRRIPAGKYDNVMTDYLELPQKSWITKFRDKRKARA